MRCRLIILGVLVFVLSSWLRPGAVWSEPLKEPAPVAADAKHNGLDEQNPGKEPPDNNIYIRHIRTYDLPQNKAYIQLPDKIFVLGMRVLDPEYYYSDIIVDTNAGIGIMRGQLFSTEALKGGELEIVCHSALYDQCSPETLIIKTATATVTPPSEPIFHNRVDILDRLRRDGDRSRQIEIDAGLLRPASISAGRSNSPEILIAYEGRVSPPKITNLRLTFPSGEMKRYNNVQLRTSLGPGSSSDNPVEDPRMPDSQVIRLEDCCADEANPECVPIDAGSLGYPAIFIRDAYAFKKGKRINLLPYLRKDSFRMLPIHGPDGILPLGPSFNESFGPESP